MELTITKDELLKGLYLAQSIADRKSPMPVLANVLLRSEGKEMIVCAATDLRVSVVAEMKADVKKEGGMSIGAKHFFEIIKNLPGKEIFFKKEDNNWAEIKGGKAQYRLVGMSDKDFPRLPDQKTVDFKEINAASLVEMINKTIFSISVDETRRHLSGIFTEWEGITLRMISTDGHRLSKIECQIGEGLDLSQGIIIPRKGLLEMKRLLEGIDGPCEVGLHEGNIFIKVKDILLTIKLVDAQFPPYDQVIPKDNEKKIKINRLLLLESLRRMSIMSNERSGGIRFDLSPGVLSIASDNPDLGEAQEEIDIDYEGNKLTIGFNSRYFIDLLSEMKSENVILEFNGELDPGLVRDTEEKYDYLGVVMPMRI